MDEWQVALSVLISILSGLGALIGGWSLWPFIGYYDEYIRIKYNQSIAPRVLRIGYISSFLAITCGFFFFYRAYYVMINQDDFHDHHDWLAFELLIGIYMFQITHFLVELYRERRRIEKIVADRNDELLSESF